MSDIRVASRYSKSLIELANEKGVLEEVHQDMILFSKVVSQNRDFQLLLTNPVVKSDKKLAVLNSIFTGKVQPMTLMFFNIVAQKKRESVLVFIAAEFEKQYNEIKGIQVVDVTSAISLSATQRESLIKRLTAETGKIIQLKESIDPSLIGGFVLRVGDKQIDSSVKNSLRKLRNDFKDNSYINKL
ncbi:ATP synthase F1 subunit delta [Pontibacter sp. E15-1]|uniref:ATP synthase F1 subunit delta n=1 Tax=Pontibacter sp. E15-1 TaxID=2919918 RepID=UPI001F4FF82B|nr:ATP synthase F1 subunit delta [Pontibacter sp. E15-1]MCJ8166132.1 ATP synthase F1 subunit delta [Pontibacter sp. E15-1]